MVIKRLIVLLSTLAITLTFSSPAFAESLASSDDGDSVTAASSDSVSTLATDTTPAKIWISDPTASKTSYGLDRAWTNKPIKLKLNGQDVAPPTPPSGIYSLTTPAKTLVVNSAGGTLHTLDYTANQNGTYSFSVKDIAGNKSSINYTVWNIDKVAPSIEWTEDVRYYEGKSVIYLIASDDLSGVDYILLPDGVTKVYADNPPVDQGYQPGDETPKIFFKYEITTNDAYTFKVYDRAGNFVSKTFEYYDLRHDYAIKANSFAIKDKVAANSNLAVSATLQNYDGPGKAVSVQVYYMDGDQKVILAYDTVDIPKASQTGPGELHWESMINLESNMNIRQIFISVGSDILNLDLRPENNIASVAVAPYPLNYAVVGLYQDKFVSPGQFVQVPVQISGTGLGDTQIIPVELSIKNQLTSRSFVYIGDENNPVNTLVQGMIPKDANRTNVQVSVRVNWDDRGFESNQADNQWNTTVFSQNSDLSLLISGQDNTDSPVKLTSSSPQTTFIYLAKYDTYNLTFKANDANEKIVQVSTLGKIFNQQSREYETSLKLEKGQSQEFEIIVESATGDSRCSYNVIVIHGNDDIDMSIQAKLPDGRVFDATKSTDTSYKINLPINQQAYSLNLTMEDSDARIVTVDQSAVGDWKYSQLKSIGVNSSKTHYVTVTSQDKSITKTIEIKVSTQNEGISAKIVNKSEIDGTVYGLGGIIRNNKFIPYGNDITSLEVAHRAGRINGIVLQIKITDSNLDQYSRGYAQLPGSDVYYTIHWNSFDGPEIMQISDIEYGYIYIDRTALRSDMNLQDVTVTLWDQATDSQADTALTKATAKVKLGVDVTAPNITATASESTGNTPKGTVTYTTKDTYMGVSKVSYRYSTDNGRTWSDDKTIPSNGTISLDGVYGNIIVELTAKDVLLNSNQLMVPLVVKSPDVAVDASIYMTTNRVSDVVFINSRSSNADSISKDVLDTFK